MYQSLKLFISGMFRNIYFGVSFISLAFATVKPLLPVAEDEQKAIRMSVTLGLVVFVIMILVAAISVYHDLRMKRLDGLYEYLPEAARGRTFKIFYELLKEGEVVEHSNTFRRQEWDKDILKKISTHCKPVFKINYLINTRGGCSSTNTITPLRDDQFSRALEQIKDYLDNMFDMYTK